MLDISAIYYITNRGIYLLLHTNIVVPNNLILTYGNIIRNGTCSIIMAKTSEGKSCKDMYRL